MATVAERILAALRHEPLDDDVLARRLGLPHRQSVNQAARRLAERGQIRRVTGPDGKIVNQLTESVTESRIAPASSRRQVPIPPIPEDEVKEAVRGHLVSEGYAVVVAWGRERGIDIDARHPDGRRLVLEAKGGVARPGAQQVNYFLNALGELLQRMDDPTATYGLALPDHRQYRGLVARLPDLTWRRLDLVVFWVARSASGLTVTREDRRP